MTYEEEVFARHVGKGVLLDSNLLLVYLTGKVGTHLFRRFKRVSAYEADDYDLLVQLLREFRLLVTTPHILTEVSNLSNSLSGSYRYDWFSNLSALVLADRSDVVVRESWVPSRELAELSEFIDFGIADAAVVKLASEVLVVTDDYRLSGVLMKRGVDVLNFGDLRVLRRRIQ